MPASSVFDTAGRGIDGGSLAGVPDAHCSGGDSYVHQTKRKLKMKSWKQLHTPVSQTLRFIILFYTICLFSLHIEVNNQEDCFTSAFPYPIM